MPGPAPPPRGPASRVRLKAPPPPPRARAALAIVLACAGAAGCDRDPAAQPSSAATGAAPAQRASARARTQHLPAPPLTLDEPEPLPATFDGKDLTSLDPVALLREARRCADAGDAAGAAAFQYWAARKTGAEQYDLACYLARLGRVEAAYYWLQRAAREDGVWAEWADQDPDLAPVRRDDRWHLLHPFLIHCQEYWVGQGRPITLLTLPEAATEAARPLPVLVWLHGTNDHPDLRRSMAWDDLREATLRLPAALVAVSGANALGPAKFIWSEVPERDAQRVADALAEVEARLPAPPSGAGQGRREVILVGFSQGAAVALEVAARHPERYAGAIAIAPGAKGEPFDRIAVPPSLSRSGFVIVCGLDDHPSRVARAAESARWLRAAGAQVRHITYGGVGHHPPPDLSQQFPEWTRLIRQTHRPPTP